MTSAELRQSFLDFFRERQHKIVTSASLMPTSPNLLFTNAGMNQFVPYFLGERKAPYKRAADTQKCIRAGGKHNDLEDVGFDTYHHTLFEMLGNWSFGDYFKQEAIEWAWELLTQVWGLPKERLYATVYKPGEGDPADFDQEAYDFWKAIFEKEGLDPNVHIVYGDKKDNFWMMGDTGPCGPCSEVHIDLTPEGNTRGALVNADSPRCIEIWNLVFIQFNANPDGSFVPLAAQHVDTGMGFERVAGIFATTKNLTDFTHPPSNYDSDLFQDLFGHISNMSGHTYRGSVPDSREDLSGEQMNDVIFRVLADHIRTLSFSIADGILPGSEGRNYVLRRILRRAVMFGKRLDLKPGFFAELVAPLVEKMSPVFPELSDQHDIIYKVIRSEEQAFDRTLDRGLRLLDRITSERDTVTGGEAFELYDTYGFPLDLTQLIARERNVTVDLAGFDAEMEKQREQARAARKTDVISVFEGGEAVHKTQFVGYDCHEITGVETELAAHIQGEEHDFLIFTQTPFYAEMGGQLGDAGEARLGGQPLKILDTVKDAAGRYLHKIAKNESCAGWVGKEVVLSVDCDRRRAIQRHHSATHLLNYALRQVLGTHIRQAGSLVSPGYLRFDFSHYEALTPEQLRKVEMIVETCILQNDMADWYEIPIEDKPDDVVAVFGEKYGSVVRVVDIGGYSRELCGGTHVNATGELGHFQITHESAISAGTRRIEAVTGQAAYDMARSDYDRLRQMAMKLSCKPSELEERLSALMEQRQELEKTVRGLEQKKAAEQGNKLLDSAIERDGLKLLAGKVEVANPGDLRGLAVDLCKQLGPSVVVLGASMGDKVSLVALCTPEAIEQGHKAGELIGRLAPKVGGKGGGKPDFAMGGGKLPAALDATLRSVF